MSKKKAVASAIPTKLYVGRVMSPDNVVEALTDRSQEEQHRVGRRWFFCGDVAAPMFNVMRGRTIEAISQRVSGFASSLGGTYGVLTHQADGHQHRLVLPLYDAEIQNAVRSIAKEPFGFLMGNDNLQESLMLLGSNISGTEMQGLPGLHTSFSDQALMSLIQEMPNVVSAMTEPDRIPDLYQEPVRSLSVSFALPASSMLRFEDQPDEVEA